MAELNHLPQIHQGPQVSYGFPHYYGSSPLGYQPQAMVGSQIDGMVHGFAPGQIPGGMGSGVHGLFLPDLRHLKPVLGVPRLSLQRRRTKQTAKQKTRARPSTRKKTVKKVAKKMIKLTKSGRKKNEKDAQADFKSVLEVAA